MGQEVLKRIIISGKASRVGGWGAGDAAPPHLLLQAALFSTLLSKETSFLQFSTLLGESLP